MSTASTTIRVSTQTRDLLATQARARGISVAALLAQLASEAERQTIFNAERTATRTEAREQSVLDETRDWEAAVGDGIV